MKATTDSNIIERDEDFRFFERTMRHIPANASPRDRVVYDHYRLVISIAADYQHQGLPIMDLVMAGITGLLLAYDHYDATTKHRFTTVAPPWIHGEICKEIVAHGHPIRQTRYTVSKLQRIRIEQERFFVTQGREATPDELSQTLGIRAEMIRALLASSQRFEWLRYEES